MLKLNKPGFKALAGIVLAVLVLVVVYFAFPQIRKSPSKTAAYSSLQAGKPATTELGSGLVVFVSEINGNPEIYTMQSDGSVVTQLTQGSDKCYSPAWSPNGKYIAFIKESEGKSSLYIMNADGGSQIQISENTSLALSFQWSPDGQMIEFSESNAGDSNASLIYVSDSVTGISVKTIDAKGSNLFAAWSPDSKQIVYAKEDSVSGKYTIYLVKNDGSDQKELGQVEASLKIIGWQDESHFMAASNQVDLWNLYRFDLAGAQPEKITSYTDSGIVTWFAGSNSLNYVTNQSASWTWHKIDGNTTTPLSTWANYASQCQKYQREKILGGASNTTSPDGMYGLVSVWCDEGKSVFYLVNNDGTVITQILDSSITDQLVDSASWSADSKSIILDLGNNQTGKSDLYLIDVQKALSDPSTKPVKLSNDSTWKYGATWQPQQ